MINVLNTRNKKTFFAGAFILSVFIVTSFYVDDVLNRNSNNKGNVVSGVNHVLRIGNAHVRIDIADTPALQEQGLSGRKVLSEDQGMYFIFNHPGIYPFWMKEMNFPIDIIWIDENMSVADITKRALPSSFPQTFVPRVPALYVLEVQAGFAERHGVKIGDQVLLNP